MEGRNLCLDILVAVAVEGSARYQQGSVLYFLLGFLKCRITHYGGQWLAGLHF